MWYIRPNPGTDAPRMCISLSCLYILKLGLKSISLSTTVSLSLVSLTHKTSINIS